MKVLKHILLLMIVMPLLSCEQNKVDNKNTTADKTDSIKIFAQARPGGEPFNFDMPIDKGLDKLEISDQISTELDSNELVLGISVEGGQFAVPLKYLSGFEVANLYLNSNNYLLTWCPLVGSARIFEGEISGDKSGFDFGRGLKDNNLLIVDRKTKTVWNQLSCQAIQGELDGKSLSPLPSIQSTWTFWKDKYPNTKLLVNKDTSEAVFPDLILQEQYYNTWVPGMDYPNNTNHQINNLGLGVEMERSSIFFPLEKLFDENSPIVYKLDEKELIINFDTAGITAWAEDSNGNMIPSTIVYDWAWNNFFPDTETYGSESHSIR